MQVLVMSVRSKKLFVCMTYDCESSDDLSWWRDIGADNFGNEIGGHADNADHCDEREPTNKNESLGQGCGAIVWNRHFGEGSREVSKDVPDVFECFWS